LIYALKKIFIIEYFKKKLVLILIDTIYIYNMFNN